MAVMHPSDARLVSSQINNVEAKITKEDIKAARKFSNGLDMSKEEYNIWMGVVPELVALGRFTSRFRQTMREYCKQVAKAAKLTKYLEENDCWLIEGPRGAPMAHPYVIEIRRSEAAAREYIKYFGLAPNLEKNLSTQSKKDEDDGF